MKRSTYILLGLFVLMMAIAYFIQRPTDIEDVTYTPPDIQISLNPSNIVKIEIDYNKQYMRLERIKDVWKLTDPVNYEVDDEAMKNLLEGMGNFKITGLVSSNPEKQKVFLVDESGTSIIFTNEDGKSTGLIIGKSDPNTKRTFVRPSTSNSVYIAQGLISSMVNRSLRDWRQRTIYRTDPDIVQLVSISAGEEKYVIRKRRNRWSTDEKPVPSNLMNSALRALSYLRADGFVDTALIINSPPKVHVEMMGKELVRLDVYPRPSSSSQYFLKTSASQNIFVVGNTLPQELNKLTEYLSTPPPVIAEKETVVTPKPVFPMPQPTTPARQTPFTPPSQPVTTQQTPKTEEPSGTLDSEGELTIHTVKKGETMTIIAKNYDVSVEQILKWNLLKSIAVRPGQELYIFVRKK